MAMLEIVALDLDRRSVFGRVGVHLVPLFLGELVVILTLLIEACLLLIERFFESVEFLFTNVT